MLFPKTVYSCAEVRRCGAFAVFSLFRPSGCHSQRACSDGALRSLSTRLLNPKSTSPGHFTSIFWSAYFRRAVHGSRAKPNHGTRGRYMMWWVAFQRLWADFGVVTTQYKQCTAAAISLLHQKLLQYKWQLKKLFPRSKIRENHEFDEKETRINMLSQKSDMMVNIYANFGTIHDILWHSFFVYGAFIYKENSFFWALKVIVHLDQFSCHLKIIMRSALFVHFCVCGIQHTDFGHWSKKPFVCCAATCMNSFRNTTQTFATWSLTINCSIQKLKFIDFPFVHLARVTGLLSPRSHLKHGAFTWLLVVRQQCKNRPPIYVQPQGFSRS